MHVGEIVENGDISEIFNNPRHPYTWALIQAIPVPNPSHKRFGEFSVGDVPNAINPPSGCRYHPRFPFAKEKCAIEVPKLEKISNNHFIASWIISLEPIVYFDVMWFAWYSFHPNTTLITFED